MKKILIIGNQGMLGQQLEKIFVADSNYEVIGWDKDKIDITNESQTREKILELKPQIIINAAAYNNVDKIETDDKEMAMKINAQAPFTLARLANEINALLLHYSSDYVFKGDQKIGYKEIDEPSPVNAYGVSKLAGEKAVQTARNYYILRSSRLFGPPAFSPGAKKSFVDLMLALAKEKKEFDLVDEEWSSPTYVIDLAIRTKEIIDFKEPYGLYHVTNSGGCTWYGFGNEVFKLAGLTDIVTHPVKSSKFPRPALRPAYSELFSFKLRPMRSWQEALKEYIASLNNLKK